MQGGVGGIEVQHDLRGWPPMGFEENVHQQRIDRFGCIADPVIALAERRTRGAQLHPVQRAFAGQWLGDLPPAGQHGQQRIVAEQLGSYLARFERILETYRSWADKRLEHGSLAGLLEGIPRRHAKDISEAFASTKPTVYEACNAATYYATHQMRSYRTAFDLLERINQNFQEQFPLSLN
jgi:hypothetical protein